MIPKYAVRWMGLLLVAAWFATLVLLVVCLLTRRWPQAGLAAVGQLVVAYEIRVFWRFLERRSPRRPTNTSD
jgi:hypothetical protein